MTIFQKLFWFKQIGVDTFCSEEKLVPLNSDKKIVSKSALSKTATHTLEGMGVVGAKVLCVLNAPNAEEDRTGICLSGPEGEMTKKMLSSIGLDLEKNTYLTYLSPWRPPGNRLLTALEIKEGLALLNQKIQQVHPTYLLFLGADTLRNILAGKTLSALRSGHATYLDYPVYATFSAAALMKNPTHKRQAWEDLQAFQKRIEAA